GGAGFAVVGGRDRPGAAAGLSLRDRRRLASRAVGGKLAIVAQRDVGLLGGVPQVAAWGQVDSRAALEVVAAVAADAGRVVLRPHLLVVVGRVRRRGPVVSVGTHLRIGIEAVQDT